MHTAFPADFSLCSVRRRFAFLFLAALLSTAGAGLFAAEPARDEEETADDTDDVMTLATHNVKADRLEDFGLRVWGSMYYKQPEGTFWPKRAPMISSIVPNTAADKAGLKPGERILKAEGQSMIRGVFSGNKWRKMQAKKWAEVAAGKKNVIWTLEVESVEKTTRTVKLAVPTAPPRWGSSIWQMPQGRSPGSVPEAGPLAEPSRIVLDNGIWMLLDYRLERVLGLNFPLGKEPTGYEWRIGNRASGLHRIFVTQFRDRTDIFLETASPATGSRIYLTSPSGALERAWQWPRKGKPGETPLEEARPGFEHELDLWTTKVGKVSARWPLEVKPGFDANAIFATLASAGNSPNDERPMAKEFLQLPAATEAQRALFADAYGKLGAEEDRWAYTETSRGLDEKRVSVKRVDPSKPEAERCQLLSVDGKPPTAEEVQHWRDEGRDTPTALGEIPPLASIVEMTDLRIFKEETAAVVFELPIRSSHAEFPSEKFQALFRVNKTYRTFEDITVKIREGFRIAGVVKVTEAGIQARFQTLDPAHPPQPVSLRGGGAIRLVLVKFSRDFEATRTAFKRVEPYVEPAAADKPAD